MWRDHVSWEHSTAAVGFHFGGRPHKRNYCFVLTSLVLGGLHQRSGAHGWKGRPRNWQRSARWYQAFCFFLVGGCSPIHSNLGFHKETGSRREAAASGSPPHAQQSRTTLFTTLSMRQQLLRPPFRWPQLSHARCCACVFKIYVFRQAKVYRVLVVYGLPTPH